MRTRIKVKLDQLKHGLAYGLVITTVASMCGCLGGGGDSDKGTETGSTPTTAYAISKEAKVTVAGGEIQGTNLMSGVRSFLGVPFAAPPVGNLRWKAPQPVVAWTGTKATQNYSSACVYRTAPVSLAGQTTAWPTSEDCLYLNAWVPPEASLPASGKWPVLVWMHGANGNNSEARYPGEQLAKKNIIVVTPQRRQAGILSNLALSALSAETENKGSSGNLDMLDMIAALQWVHDNIAKFGGDPDNVTLGGLSQGSVNTARLQASPLTKGLFKRVFAQSGSFLNGTSSDTGTTLSAAQAVGAAWMAKFGTVTGTTAAASVADLRAKATSELFLVSGSSLSGGMDYVLPDTVNNLFLAGKQNDVPMYIGYCNDETVSRALSGVTDLATYNTALTGKFGTDAANVFNLYPAFNDTDAVSQALRVNNDYEFGKQMVSWARLQKAKGASTVYMYRFYRGNSVGAGARHGNDVNYWAGNLTAPYSDNTLPYATPADYELSERMMESLVSWVSMGNPSTASVKVPEYNRNDQQVIGFDVNAIAQVPIYKGVDWFIDNASKY